MNKDITVEQIIKTFKGVKRKQILSSNVEDDFLKIMKNKKQWTYNEFEHFFKEFSIQNLKFAIFDFMIINQIQKKFNFKMNWNIYLEVIDSLKTINQKKIYINYYLWYHHVDLTEDVYSKIKEKNYDCFLNKKSIIKFLSFKLPQINESNWIDTYFNEDELVKALNKCRFNIFKKTNKDVINYYHKYEHLMNNRVKNNFFNAILRDGNLELIEFFYTKKNIKPNNRLYIIRNICVDYATGDVFEILKLFHELGVNFNENYYYKLKKENKLPYVENKESIERFFKFVNAEKEYIRLTDKYKSQNLNQLKKI